MPNLNAYVRRILISREAEIKRAELSRRDLDIRAPNVAVVVLHRTAFGRYLYAVGRNEEAARFSGSRCSSMGEFSQLSGVRLCWRWCPIKARRLPDASPDGAATTSASNCGSSHDRSLRSDCLLLIERSWTADEGTIPKIKSQEAVRLLRNADPGAQSDFAGFEVTTSEP